VPATYKSFGNHKLPDEICDIKYRIVCIWKCQPLNVTVATSKQVLNGAFYCKQKVPLNKQHCFPDRWTFIGWIFFIFVAYLNNNNMMRYQEMQKIY
jgi:hypothetical protein